MNTRTASFLPRLVQFLLLLLAGALLARAADSPTVIYSTLRLNGAAFSNVIVQLTPIQLSTMSNSIVAPFTYSNVTRYDGTLTITSVVPQSYRVTLRYATGITSFTNCFSGLTGTIYASDYICGASPTNGLIAYSTAQADALFALRTNAIRMQTNGVSVAAGFTNLNWASGVTGYLSGATLVLGVSSAGTSVDTNAFQPASATLTNLSGTGALTNSAAFQPANTTLSNIANSTTLVVTNGRVGVATNAPGVALDVQGGMRISHGITNGSGFPYFASGGEIGASTLNMSALGAFIGWPASGGLGYGVVNEPNFYGNGFAVLAGFQLGNRSSSSTSIQFSNAANASVAHFRTGERTNPVSISVASLLLGTNNNTAATVFIRAGTGAPESNVTAPVGSIWLRTDGSGVGGVMYVKTNGTGNTGWWGVQ